jgi:hypothetical protein
VTAAQRVETPQPSGRAQDALLQQLAALEPPSTSSTDASTSSSVATSRTATYPRWSSRHPAERAVIDGHPVFPQSLEVPPHLSREGSGASISSGAVAAYGSRSAGGSNEPRVTAEASLSPLHCVPTGVVANESGLLGDAESPDRGLHAFEPWADENAMK